MPEHRPDSHTTVLRYRITFCVMLAVAVAIRLWFATSLAISGDEAYHWEWSRRLAASYYDHPGLTAWLIHISGCFLPGTSELSVRLPAILCLTATTIVAYRFAAMVATRSGDAPVRAERAGFIAGVLIMVTPILAFFAIYMSTDPPFILFATLTWYLLFRAVEGGGWLAWIGAGIWLGLAADTKFLAFVIPPTALAILWVHRPYRRWLRRSQPWVALAVAVMVFSPVLWWNAQHDWATFRFNFDLRHNVPEPISLMTPLEYIGGQILVLLPMLFAAAVTATVGGVRAWRGGDGSALLLVVAAVSPLMFFFVSSFHRSIGLHWPAAFWTTLLVYIGVRWARLERRPMRRNIAWVIGTTGAIVTLGHLLAHAPPSWTDYDLAYPRDPSNIKLERLNERFGWPELGRRAEQVKAEMRMAHPDEDVFFIASSYGVAAGLSFYLPDQGRVHLWSPRRAHGENYRYWDRFDELKGRNALFVVKRDYQVSQYEASLRQHFASVAEAEEFVITINGRGVRSFYLVRCYGFDGSEPF